MSLYFFISSECNVTLIILLTCYGFQNTMQLKIVSKQWQHIHIFTQNKGNNLEYNLNSLHQNLILHWYRFLSSKYTKCLFKQSKNSLILISILQMKVLWSYRLFFKCNLHNKQRRERVLQTVLLQMQPTQ